MAEIQKVLVATTAHITKEDRDRLELGDFPTSMATDDYGYWLWAKIEAKYLYSYGYSDSLVQLIAFAREQGCEYLHLDCDGPTYDHLETYEW